jgi:hypothetical protein
VLSALLPRSLLVPRGGKPGSAYLWTEIADGTRHEVLALHHPVPLHELGREFAPFVGAVQPREDFVLVRDVDCVCSTEARVADVELPSHERARRDFTEDE